VRRVRELLSDAIANVEALIRDGKTLAQIQSAIDLSAHRKAFAPWQGVRDATWKANTDALVERVWRGVRGQG
jgi:hypothetical protein